MLRGLNTAAAGLIANQRRHDTVTNNIANMNTPGYKANVAIARSFPEMLIQFMGGNGMPSEVPTSVGRLNTGVFVEETPYLYKQGELMETQDPSDFALISNIQVGELTFDASGKATGANGEVVYQPQAMFAVRDAEGRERYTRNGKFTIDEAGQLVTSDGHLVLDNNRNPIVFDRSISEIKATEDGGFVNGITGERLPVSLFVARIENPNRLIRDGFGNFRLPDGDGQPPVVAPGEDVTVYQGFVEGSNVDPTQSMVDLMAAQRAYETNQRMVQFYDRSLERAVNEVGRV
jgi:flagellar basal-body rod protein FlgF